MAKEHKNKSHGVDQERGRGQPAYEPTAKSRARVRSMASIGISHEEISRSIDPPCSPKTLRKYYEAELALAEPEFKDKIGSALLYHLEGKPAEYDKDGSLLREEVKPNATVAIFLAKTRLGFTERERTSAPLLTPEMLRGLNDQEIHDLKRIVAKAISAEREALGAADNGIDAGGGGDETRH